MIARFKTWLHHNCGPKRSLVVAAIATRIKIHKEKPFIDYNFTVSQEVLMDSLQGTQPRFLNIYLT